MRKNDKLIFYNLSRISKLGTMVLIKLIIITIAFTPICTAYFPFSNTDSKSKTTTTNKPKLVTPESPSKATLELRDKIVQHVMELVFNRTQEAYNNTIRSTEKTLLNSTTERIIFKKGEYEGDFYEQPDHPDCNNPTQPGGSGQEIDETRKGCECVNTTKPGDSGQEIDESGKACNVNETSTTSTTTTTEAPEQEIDETDPHSLRNFSLESLPPVQLDLFNFQLLSPQRTTTYTITKIQPYTVFDTQIKSCLKLEEVSKICDGRLLIVRPTPTLARHIREIETLAKMNYEVMEQPENADEPILIQPTMSTPQLPQTSLSHPLENQIEIDTLDASYVDYDFDLIQHINENGPEKFHTSELEQVEKFKSQYSEILKHLVTESQVKFVTQFISSTVTKTLVETDITATVIAKNCIPRDADIPFCHPRQAFKTLQSLLVKKDAI